MPQTFTEFKLNIVKRNGTPLGPNLVYQVSSSLECEITDHFLAIVYSHAFQAQLAHRRGLESCVFCPAEPHEISDGLLAQIRTELGNQFFVGRAGEGTCVKIEDRGRGGNEKTQDGPEL